MILGTCSAGREALIRLNILGEAAAGVTVPAAIDTGFTEYLTLPVSAITALDLQQMGSTPMVLADGTTLEVAVFLARVEWDGALREVPVHAADGGVLAGMALLKGSRVTLDVVDGGVVTIEPLP
jgi:clan AA aspartic protease